MPYRHSMATLDRTRANSLLIFQTAAAGPVRGPKLNLLRNIAPVFSWLSAVLILYTLYAVRILTFKNERSAGSIEIPPYFGLSEPMHAVTGLSPVCSVPIPVARILSPMHTTCSFAIFGPNFGRFEHNGPVTLHKRSPNWIFVKSMKNQKTKKYKWPLRTAYRLCISA